MSRFFFPIFLVLLFILWKALDSLHLPNVFSILLLIVCIICGIAWCYRRFVVLPKRQRQALRAENRSGNPLTEEEKARLVPISEGTEYLAGLFPILAIIFIIRSFIYEPFQIPSGSMEPTLRVGDFLVVEKFAYGIKDPIFQHKLIATGTPKRGDVVVFKAPPQPTVDYIKRVIGLPGDHIIYNQRNGTLTVIPACNVETMDCSPLTYQYEGTSVNDEFVYYNNPQIERTEKGEVIHQILLNPDRFNYDPYYFKQDGLATGEWIVPKGHYFMMGDNRDNSQDSRFWGFVPEEALVGKASRIIISLDKKANEWPTGFRTDRFFKKIH